MHQFTLNKFMYLPCVKVLKEINNFEKLLHFQCLFIFFNVIRHLHFNKIRDNDTGILCLHEMNSNLSTVKRNSNSLGIN